MTTNEQNMMFDNILEKLKKKPIKLILLNANYDMRV